MNHEIPGTPAYRQYSEYLQFRIAMLECKHTGTPTTDQLMWRLNKLVRERNIYLDQALEDLAWTCDAPGMDCERPDSS
jgi:hypothetical protein